MEKEVSNRIIIILAVLVVIIVAVSTWLTVGNLNANQPKVVKVTERIVEGPPSGGQVSLAILPQPNERGEA